jgi:DNA-binding response OmpR family regulator
MESGTGEGHRRILLLAADRGLGEALEAELKEAGFELDVTTDPEQARQRASLRCHAAFVVDVSLPDGAGFRFVAELREAGRGEPVLLLSAPHAPEDMLSVQRGWPDWQPVVREGLNDAPEVLRALLRHEQPNVARRLRYGGIILDRVERRACVEGQEVRLTPAEWGILEYLLAHAEHVVARESILKAVWGPDPDLNSNAMDVHMGHLRQKLDDAGLEDVIETLRGRGYILRIPSERDGAAV